MTALIQAVEAELATAEQRQSDLQSELDQLDTQIENLHKIRELADDLDGGPSVPEISKPSTLPSRPEPAQTKPKRKPPTARPTTAQIVALIKRDGTAAVGAVEREFRCSYPTAKSAVQEALASGAIVKGEPLGRGHRYVLPKATALVPTNPTGGASKPTASGRQNPTLTGRVAALIQYQHFSPTKIAQELDESVSDVMGSLKTLEAEGEASHEHGIWRGRP